MFQIHSVDIRAAVEVEPLGTKPKFWYLNDEQLFLFKADERGTGEDWAEKIACELAGLLGIPHVHYELAQGMPDGNPGVICANFAPPPYELVLGSRLLQYRSPTYPSSTVGRYGIKEHTVNAVAECLEAKLHLPATPWADGLPDGMESALDVFIGYVMLDALIANQDRHHENWGAILMDDALRLAPSFDHGAALARNISDDERKERLTTRDRNRHLHHFVKRARSAFYELGGGRKPMSTLAAWHAFSQMAPQAARLWLERLEPLDDTALDAVLGQVPRSRMSTVCKEFTCKLMAENRYRLLTGRER